MFSLDQYTAAHTGSIIVDRSGQGKVVITGTDRLSFLHALLTNDIARLAKGTGTYSAYLTPQGRMISDMRVIETGDRIVLDVEGAVAAPLAERFDKLIFAEDVQVQNVSDELAEIGVHGPSAADVVERATGISVARLENQYDNIGSLAGPITLVRDDSLGLRGFDLYVPRQGANHLRAKLADAGAMEASPETAELLRIEAGRPRFGIDMDTETIPLEAGIEDRAISFTKGCYVGQEVIIRVMHRGHGRVARRLVGLLIDDGAVPSRGDVILAGEKGVGEITSAAESPLMGSPIALGYVQRDYATPGMQLLIRATASPPATTASPTVVPTSPGPPTRQPRWRGLSAIPARVHQIPFSR
jgi:folate-binding protein YgfZ